MYTVYIETSIVSHATALPSEDPLTAVLQQQAKRWWDEERGNYRLVTSQFVVDEAADGDAEAARRRLEMLDGIPLLLHSERVEEISNEMIRRSLMPEKAKLDALHVASAAVGGVHYAIDAKLQAHRERTCSSTSLRFARRTGATPFVDLHACGIFRRA